MSSPSAVTFQFQAETYPTRPGVYLMRDPGQKVLYVGKANNLRQRLRNYFAKSGDSRPQVRFLIQRVHSIDTIVTDTAKEALLLENTLIKKHRPRYNIHLRDDKTFVSLRLNPKEEFPTLQIVRQVKPDGALYFGPYTSAGAVKETLKEIFRVFPLRHYPLNRCRQRGRPCLFHQIGQCSAPCHGKISNADYQLLVDGVVALLSGRDSGIRDLLQTRMQQAAQRMDFEAAATLRDQIQAIEKTVEQQKVSNALTLNQDVIGLHRSQGEVLISLLFIRSGKLVGRRNFPLEWRFTEDELLGSFLQEYYDRDVIVPDEIILPFQPAEAELIEEWLSDRRGRKVHLTCPKWGRKTELLKLAERNAAEAARERGEQQSAKLAVLDEIRERLQLRRLPQRLECFDISNFQGQQSVGSMAVMLDGEPTPREYRHYLVREVAGANDFASLAEVIKRRLKRGLETGLPDCILIDGGKGQLGVLQLLLEEFELQETIDAIGIAKSRVFANVRGKLVEKSEERFFRPGRKNPITLRQGSAALFLLEQLRNEAHRFAITHHRKLRTKQTLTSQLEQIPGIGPARRKQLIKQFGSLKRIRQASVTELATAPGISIALAQTIHLRLNP
ncbi:MAG TPA: excinuclease ABC subunit UvrC [Geothermobacteraceae bacterium]|nr:excinuclease ABC subunit UvrC [Geothermobacteraceae bacterium]